MILLQDIESFIACFDLDVRKFEDGAKAAGLVRRLKRGAQPLAVTEERVRAFMDNFHNTPPSHD